MSSKKSEDKSEKSPKEESKVKTEVNTKATASTEKKVAKADAELKSKSVINSKKEPKAKEIKESVSETKEVKDSSESSKTKESAIKSNLSATKESKESVVPKEDSKTKEAKGSKVQQEKKDKPTLENIVAIASYPGLYRVLLSSNNGVIVENLSTDTKLTVPSSSKITSLLNIQVYTIEDEVSLGTVLDNLTTVFKGKNISHKDSNETIKEYFKSALPTYDKERVRVSDMKKIISWYNILSSVGLSNFASTDEI